MLNFDQYEVLTFDCYGTLIDWESGILSAMRPVLSAHGLELADDQILELYGAFEAEAEAGPFQNYRSVLRQVMAGFGRKLNFSPEPAELDRLADSMKDWPPFSDSAAALSVLKQKYKLAILSNVDDALFSFSAAHLQVKFDWVITAEQVKSYKPSLNNFKQAIERIGLPQEKILHVAQSLYHDIAPAKKLGLSTVWINRRAGKEGYGATPPMAARPDLEVPDLKTLAATIGLQA